MGLDARAGSQLARLGLRADLADTQVQAGFLLQRIYVDFERWHGRRRAASGPGYVRWIAPSQEDEADADDRDRLEEAAEERDAREERLAKRAKQRMEKLEKCFDILPPESVARARSVLEAICVEDQPIPDAVIDDVAFMLGHIAGRFGLGPQSALPSIAITARRPARTRQTPPRERRTELDKQAFLHVARDLKRSAGEDPTPEELEQAWRDYHVVAHSMRARESIRRKKGRGR